MTRSSPPTPPAPGTCSYEPIRSSVTATGPLTDRRPSSIRDPYGHLGKGATTLSARVLASEQI